MPLSFSEPQYAIHVAANDIDLGASPIWYDRDGNLVAAAVLGVREKRGWIGGFGIVPAHRGRGLGHALLADVLERAWSLDLESVTLEVLAQNTAARRTYVAGGFMQTRLLVYYGVDAEAVGAEPTDAPYVDAERFFEAEDETAPCWQLESVSLRRVTPQVHAVGDERAFCIFRHDGTRAQVLKVRAPSASDLGRLAASVVAQTAVARVEMLAVLAGSRVAAAAGSLGWNLTYQSEEMRLRRPDGPTAALRETDHL